MHLLLKGRVDCCRAGAGLGVRGGDDGAADHSAPHFCARQDRQVRRSLLPITTLVVAGGALPLVTPNFICDGKNVLPTLIVYLMSI